MSLPLRYDRYSRDWEGAGAEYLPFKPDAFRTIVYEDSRSILDTYAALVPPDEATDRKSRVLHAMWEHMYVGGDAPVCVLFCVQPQRGASDLQQGGSIFPAVQNFLLAARAQGLGAAITLWHDSCGDDLRTLVGIPDDWRIATLITAGWPRGGHHPVRCKPIEDVVAIDAWNQRWERCS